MKMNTLDVIAYRIKKLLAETGWSQARLGEKIGVAQQTVQRWATGKGSPTPDNLDKLAEVTGHPAYWFMLPPDEEVPEGAPELTTSPEDERLLLTIYRQLPKTEQDNMLQVFSHRLKELEEWVDNFIKTRDKLRNS